MEIKKNERYCEYHICIPGDDYTTGNIVLSDSEAAVFKKILNCLVREGKYAPVVQFINMDETRRLVEEHKKQEAEEHKKKLDHAMGLDIKCKTDMEIAFEKAMKKKA